MGEYADAQIANYLSGRWGMRIPEPREYPTTTKAAIADNPFHIVEVVGAKGVRTNRKLGSKLVVCDNGEDHYWVWASHDVTGILKSVCRVVEGNLKLSDALEKTGRKPYKTKQ